MTDGEADGRDGDGTLTGDSERVADRRERQGQEWGQQHGQEGRTALGR